MRRDIGDQAATRLWRPEGHPGVLLLTANYDRQRFARHFHDEFVVGVNVRGAHAFRCRGASHAVPAGSVALVDPGEIHTGEVLGDLGWRYRSFFVEAEVMRDLWRDVGGAGDPSFTASSVDDPDCAAALVAAHRACEPASSSSSLVRDSLLVHALGMLLRKHGSGGSLREDPGAPAGALEEVRDAIDGRLREPMRLGELAAVAGLRRFQLLRSFKQRFGLAPHQYLVARRVTEARRLIESGERLSVAAFRVGFADQSHMNRHFKRFLGFTPGQLARAQGDQRAAAPRYSATR